MLTQDATKPAPAGQTLGADRIEPKRWLAVYVVIVALMAGLTILLPTQFRMLGAGCTYLLLATTLIPLNVTLAVLFMASRSSVPSVLTNVLGPLPAGYPVVIVALAAAVATTIANLADYHVIVWLTRIGKVRKVARTKFYERVSAWFTGAPFFLTFLINALPVPVGVDRLLAAPSGYNRPKFAAATFLGRFPRYWLTAAISENFQFTWWQIILICAGIALLGFLAGKIKRAVFGKKSTAAPTIESKAAVCANDPGR